MDREVLALPDRVKLRRSRMATVCAISLASATLAAAPVSAQDYTFDDMPIDYPAPKPAGEVVAIGDVNGDRLDDMVAFSPSRRQYPEDEQLLLVYLQEPDHALAAPISLSIGDTATEYTIGIGDFNEDGINDIAVGMGYGITMLLADGEGGFVFHQHVDGDQATVARIVDINGDGHLDILSAGREEHSAILGDGEGMFQSRTTIFSVANPQHSVSLKNALAYGDVSGDGLDDVVAISRDSLFVAKGDGLGHFQPPVEYGPRGQYDVNDVVSIGDTDGDGRNEVVISGSEALVEYEYMAVYRYGDDGNLLQPEISGGGSFTPSIRTLSAMVRDLDGDDKDDYLALVDDIVGFHLQGENGLSAERTEFNQDVILGDMAVGDLNDDGCIDVALATNAYSGGLRVLHGMNCHQSEAVSDFNGDGVSDLLWHNAVTGASSIWQSADAEMTLPVTQLNDSLWSIVGTGDLNGDSKADIVWHHPATGAGAIWLSADNRTQQTLTRITDPAWKIVGVGDFDGGGKDDLLWRHASTGRNAIWKAGDYRTQLPVTSVTDVGWKVAGIGDFDGDGSSDILWRHDTSGANAIWKKGDYRSQISVTAVTNVEWRVAGVGDFDGDGIDDLFWRHERGSNTIWRSAVYAQQSRVPHHPTRWSLAAVGDYDGNGKDDLIWRNALDGSNRIWRSAASTVTQEVSSVVDQDWQLH